jgi:hypothetical protein
MTSKGFRCDALQPTPNWMRATTLQIRLQPLLVIVCVSKRILLITK